MSYISNNIPAPFFIPIPHFVFENASPELLKLIKKLPNHKFLADHCKPYNQYKMWKEYKKFQELQAAHSVFNASK